MKPLVIRVYPEHRSLYFKVFIWPDLKTFRHENRDVPGARKMAGVCQGYQRIRISQSGRQHKRPVLGEIHLARGRLGSQVISHEFVHAALVWSRRVGLDFDPIVREGNGAMASPEEERFVHACSTMIGQFVARCYALKLY